jgi:hypothetical protein
LPHFDSFYNGLEVKLEKRFSNGLTFRTAYTWSKDLGTGQGTPGGAVQDSFHVGAERGYVEPDFHHRFVASWVYQLPFGRGKAFGRNWNRATVDPRCIGQVAQKRRAGRDEFVNQLPRFLCPPYS